MGWRCGRAVFRLATGLALALGGTPAGFGQVVINEIMQNPGAVSDSAGEWFELYNAGSSSVDINGWTIEDNDTDSHTIDSANGTTTIAAGGYLVLGRNATTSSNGGVTVDYVYGSWTLANGADEVVLVDASSVEQDRVEYDGGPDFPDPNGASMALKATNLDNNQSGNWCESQNVWAGSVGDRGTPGAANDCPMTPPPPPTFAGEIFSIQGTGTVSVHAGAMATTADNIVTAVGAGGFFIQTPADRSDNSADTSDGIFVLHDGSPTVSVGDQVDVTGEVQDGSARPAYGLTRIDATAAGGSVTIDASNQPLPDPVEFNVSRPSPDPANPSCALEYECYEGMRIRIATGTVGSGSQSFGSDPVAEMYITPTLSRAFREPGIEYPGLPGLPVWDGNPEVFELDPDKLGLANESWAPGTTFSATGVLGYEFGGYEIWPTELDAISEAAALPRAARAKRSGEVTVASQNLLNLRSSSGATKLGKLSLHVREVLGSPDIIAVQEVYGLTALENLADRIRSDDAGVDYTAYVQAPGSSMAVGFLVRSGVTVRQITEHGRDETFVDPRDGSVDPLHDRPPVVLDATVGGLKLSVVVVHNRSLSGVDDASRGEWVRTKRLEQAQSVARLVESLQNSKTVVVGDFNAFEFTDGYVDVVGHIKGTVTPEENLLSGSDLVSKNLCNLVDLLSPAERYSFVFQGNAQALDHALVNQSLGQHVVEMQYARGNADAWAGADDDAAHARRASDHDGLVVYLTPDPINPSPCAPPPIDPLPVARADLSLTAESQIISEQLVRYSVSVRNSGPDQAVSVVVENLLAAGIRLNTSTSGCAEDPGGVPSCNLGHISAGEAVSFTIDVASSGTRAFWLRYRGSVDSNVSDPTPENAEVEKRQYVGRPEVPSDFTATAISSTEIELRWRDNSSVETGYDVFLQGPGDSTFRLIGTLPADSTSVVVNDLVSNIEYSFVIEARNGPFRSERPPVSTATTFSDRDPPPEPPLPAHCDEQDVLCLGDFEVEVDWGAGNGRSGRGRAERLTAETGDFWFFDPANIELLVKVLDGCTFNGHYWVFAAGLTNVEVAVTVRDLVSGLERRWTNPLGSVFEPILDSTAFATCDSQAGASAAVSDIVLSGAPRGRLDELSQASLTNADGENGASSVCAASDTSLCLEGSRYEVRASWVAGERSGQAFGVPRTEDTGMFWFFTPANVELVVKVLDGCEYNGHRWVIMGGLTDVGVEITVADGATGAMKRYQSPESSPFATMFDTTAFTCTNGQ